MNKTDIFSEHISREDDGKIVKNLKRLKACHEHTNRQIDRQTFINIVNELYN
jgi:hypothetical protein